MCECEVFPAMTTSLKDRIVWMMRHRPGWVVFGICLSAALVGTYIRYTHRDQWTTVVRELPRDDRTYTMSMEEEKKLSSQSQLHPTKSRGSTIFEDKEGHVRIPPAYVLDRMHFRDLSELYHRYLESIQVVCANPLHLGDLLEGGSDICTDKGVKPQKNCLAYIIGTRDDFSFDDDLASVFDCEVHSFCASCGKEDHQHSSSVYFHARGVADYDGVTTEKWEMRRLQTLKRELGHQTRPIDVLKLNIGGGEWTSLPEIISSGLLDEIKQLIVEFSHMLDKYPKGFDHRTSEHFKMYLNIFRTIYEKGFRIFMFQRNTGSACLYSDVMAHARTGCHQIQFMKVTGAS